MKGCIMTARFLNLFLLVCTFSSCGRQIESSDDGERKDPIFITQISQKYVKYPHGFKQFFYGAAEGAAVCLALKAYNGGQLPNSEQGKALHGLLGLISTYLGSSQVDEHTHPGFGWAVNIAGYYMASGLIIRLFER